MLDWNESQNWTREEYDKAIRDAKACNDPLVNLDTEHASADNERELVRWAQEDGYKAEIDTHLECVTVYLEKGALHEVKGDLLTSGCDFICHQVNCQGRMNSGIAKSIREKWPKVYEEYALKCNGPKDKNDPLLGSVQLVETLDCTVINMFSQEHYGYDGKRYTSYDAFWECLQRIKAILGPDPTKKIGFPKNIGCCRGGADWAVIKTMIQQVLGDYDVYIYELEV